MEYRSEKIRIGNTLTNKTQITWECTHTDSPLDESSEPQTTRTMSNLVSLATEMLHDRTTPQAAVARSKNYAPRDARAPTGTRPRIQAPCQHRVAAPHAEEETTRRPCSRPLHSPSRTAERATESKAHKQHDNNLGGAHLAPLAAVPIISAAISPNRVTTKHLKIAKHPSKSQEAHIMSPVQRTQIHIRQKERQRERQDRTE